MVDATQNRLTGRTKQTEQMQLGATEQMGQLKQMEQIAADSLVPGASQTYRTSDSNQPLKPFNQQANHLSKMCMPYLLHPLMFGDEAKKKKKKDFPPPPPDQYLRKALTFDAPLPNTPRYRMLVIVAHQAIQWDWASTKKRQRQRQVQNQGIATPTLTCLMTHHSRCRLPQNGLCGRQQPFRRLSPDALMV